MRRLELTFCLPCWFGSVWPFSLLAASVNTLLSQGLGPVLPMSQVNLIAQIGSVLELPFEAVGVLSLLISQRLD